MGEPVICVGSICSVGVWQYPRKLKVGLRRGLRLFGGQILHIDCGRVVGKGCAAMTKYTIPTLVVLFSILLT